MKKSILIAILSVFAFMGSFGQIFQTTTASLTPSQDTSCAGSVVTLQFSIKNMNPTTQTLTGSCCRIRCNGVDIATLSVSGVLTPSASTTFSSITGSLPIISNGSYKIFVYFCYGCTTSTVGATTIMPSPPQSIYILNPPTLTVAPSGPTSFCVGDSVQLSSSTAGSYTWSSGQNTQSVTIKNSGVYSVNTNSNMCGTSTSNSISVTVNAKPTVSVSSSNSNICIGQSATLFATGASTYSWNTSASGSSIMVSPTVTTNYTVIGTSSLGCSNSAIITQSVSTCTGINNSNSNKIVSKVYPNPANDNLNIELENINENSKLTVNIYSVEGRNVYSDKFDNTNKLTVDVSNLATGMYVLEIVSDSLKSTKNIIVAR